MTTDNKPQHYYTDGSVLNSVVQAVSNQTATNSYTQGAGNYNSQGYEFIWRNSMIARKAADALPKQALSVFRGWTVKESTDREPERAAYAWFTSQVYPELLSAAVKGRIYGDGFAIMLFDDGQPLSEPLDVTKITDFYGVIAKSSVNLHAIGPTGDIGTAQQYSLSLSHAEGLRVGALKSENRENSISSYTIHRSRVIHFPGLIDYSDHKEFNLGTNQSIFDYCTGPVNEYLQAAAAGVNMLKTHSTYIIGIDGLAVNTKRRAIGALSDRLASIMQTIKHFGGVVIDSKKEEATIVNRTYSGVDTVIKQVEQALKNSVDVPASFIVSASDSSYSEAAIGDRYEMATLIDEYYSTHLNNTLMQVFRGYAAWQGLDYDKYTLAKVSALKLTRDEEADVRFKNAQTDSLYLMSPDPNDPLASVLYPEDIRTRWESLEYSDDITITEKPEERARDLVKLREIRTKMLTELEKNPLQTPDKTGGLGEAANRMATGANGRSAYNGQEMK